MSIPRMKSSPPQGQVRAKALTHDDLSARFRVLEEQLLALKSEMQDEPPHVEEPPPAPEPRPTSYTREQNNERLVALLELGAAVTVREIAEALGVGNKTAYRLANDVAFEKKGFLYFEPHKNTLRLRLVSPSRVLVDAKSK
jgi:hypothetical protein